MLLLLLVILPASSQVLRSELRTGGFRTTGNSNDNDDNNENDNDNTNNDNDNDNDNTNNNDNVNDKSSCFVG